MNQAKLKSLLNYDLETGNFHWQVNRGSLKKGSKAGSPASRDRYIVIVIEGKKYFAHRLAFLYMEGRWPEQIDHINHVREDNSWDNLREVTHQENHRNKPLQSNNKSGYHGVSWDKLRGKWTAFIKIDGKKKHLGRFETKEQAIEVRKEAELNSEFHSNHGASHVVQC